VHLRHALEGRTDEGGAALVRRHLEGIVAWAQTRQTNGFLEALNGLFQAAKRRARSFTRFDTIRTVIFLIAGKLDFRAVNPSCPATTRNSTEPQKKSRPGGRLDCCNSAPAEFCTQKLCLMPMS
jgi:hypothetical protein